MTALIPAVALGLAVAMSAAWAVQRLTGNTGWVDVFWTASAKLRELDPRSIGKVYFRVLCVYGTCGLLLLTLTTPGMLLKISTNLYNYALGFSCFHVIAVSTTLLPRDLRPSVLRRCALGSAGVFFLVIAVLSTYAMRQDLIDFYQRLVGTAANAQ